MYKVPAVDRYWQKVEKTSGCWLWHGMLIQGYAVFNVGGRRVRVARWAYEEFVGPIPEGYEIDHVLERGCVNRNCVNPSHLEAVTHTENMLRIPRKFQTVCKNGHQMNAENRWESGSRGGSRTTRCRKCNAANAKRWRQLQSTN